MTVQGPIAHTECLRRKSVGVSRSRHTMMIGVDTAKAKVRRNSEHRCGPVSRSHLPTDEQNVEAQNARVFNNPILKLLIVV
jgi:predicted urease superfamily metal-dependent hydrolase